MNGQALEGEIGSKRSRRWLGTLLAGTLALLTTGLHPPAVAATGLTMFVLDSTPGEFVVGGKTYVFTSEDSTIAAGQFGDGVTVQVSSPNHTFWANVTPPTGQALAPGTYQTTRFETGSTAGLSVSGDGVGCNSATGIITVHEVSIQTQPEVIVERFAATFEYRCEGISPPLFGELRYLSSVDVRAATADPFTAHLGESLVGVTGAPSQITIANAGTLDLTLGSVSFSGPDAADFAVVDDPCSNSTLAPDASCALDITVTPSEEGTRNAVLHLVDNTARGRRDVILMGTGIVRPTVVGLRVSSSAVRYGAKVNVTANLQDFEEAHTKELAIYAKPYGGVYRRILSGPVDGMGDLIVSFTMKKKTTFVAKFLGDDVFSPTTSPTATVNVFAIAQGSLKGFYGTSGGYKLYRYTSNCPEHGRGCPTYAVTVVPNHRGKPVCFTLQVYSRSWRTAIDCFRLRLSSRSKAAAYFIYANRGVIGLRTRLRASFRGDADHQGAKSRWAYFRVTT
jgi:hypothetical protein